MFKKLHILPEMTRNEEEDGYCYPEEYINNIYEHKDQYVYFKESSYEILHKGFVEVVIEAKIKTALEDNENIENLNTRLDGIIEKITDKTGSEDMIEVQNHLEKNIMILRNDFEKQISDIKKESEELISKELQVVHDNIQKTVNELISKREPAKPTAKVNLGTLFALKEAGYSPKEIGELKKEKLI